ncbi:MAG: PAS domain-containing protein [Burkholderiaceae bacterium]|nr:PAS domain-containing protein [Burkholderiaceae bacterium]
MNTGAPQHAFARKPWLRRAIGVLGVLFLASMVWTAMGPAEIRRSAALAAFAGLLLWLLLHQLLQLGAARDALEASRRRFELAVAGSDDGIWDWDFASQQIYLSARARALLGVAGSGEVQSREEVFSRVRMHPDDALGRDEALEAHLAGRTPAFEGEYRIVHPGGEMRWIHVRGLCVRGDDARPRRIAGSISDIDARKCAEQALRRSEQALRESEERYQLAVDGANEGLWDWDLPSDMLYLSPRAQQVLSLASGGDSRRPRRQWKALATYHPDDVQRTRAALAAHLQGDTPNFDIEYRIRHADGRWHWYRQHGIALRDAAGRAYRMAGSMEDVSDRKNAEADRDRLEQQLHQAQKLEAMGTLAGGIAHDFNNILAAILGYGEMAQKAAAEGTELRRHIDATISAGMRAKSLVARILAFSRSGIGEREPVHVQAVVTEVLEQIAASMPAGIRVERHLDAGDAAVLGDTTQIHQVVMNLCANAVQAIGTDGTLSMRVDTIEFDAPQCVTTSELAAGAYVRLVVADTGVGIPSRLLERIFDPFFTTRDIGVGTGLGLSLVHGIVTDLGGGIAVTSRPGEGTTMTVYLPRVASAVLPVPIEEEPAALGRGQTVLLVDDETALVRLGEELLARLGYEPVGFASSAQALECFRAEPRRFDLVLSDEAMPALTGSELAQQIRAIRPELPIVLMSGYVSPALAARAKDLGVVEILGKPLVAREMARSLSEALHAAGRVATTASIETSGGAN